MTTEKDLGKVTSVPAGDHETAKHPANDAAPDHTDRELGQTEFRDREATLAQDAGDSGEPSNTKAPSDSERAE